MTQFDCKHVQARLDDLLDGYLPGEAATATRSHLAHCGACAAQRDALQSLRDALRNMPIPELPAGFADTALATAARQANDARAAAKPPRSRRNTSTWSRGIAAWLRRDIWIGATLGATAAAALLVMLWGSPQQGLAPEAQAPVRIALYEPREITVAIEAVEPMSGAMLTVLVSGGIDVVGFGDRREVRWQTDLDSGTNMLSLPIIAHSLDEGTLSARVEYGDMEKLITVRVHVDPPSSD